MLSKSANILNLSDLVKEDYGSNNADCFVNNDDSSDSDEAFTCFDEPEELITLRPETPKLNMNHSNFLNTNQSKEFFRRLVHILIFEIPVNYIDDIIIEDLFFTTISITDLIELTLVPCEEIYDTKNLKEIIMNRPVKIKVCQTIRDYLIDTKLTFNSNIVGDHYICVEAEVVNLLTTIRDDNKQYDDFDIFDENIYFCTKFFYRITKIITDLLDSQINLKFRINLCKERLQIIKRLISSPVMNKDHYNNIINNFDGKITEMIKERREDICSSSDDLEGFNISDTDSEEFEMIW